MTKGSESVPDVTLAYRRWDELFGLGLRMALGESDETRAEGRARLARAQQRSLKERDAVWARIVGAIGRLSGH